MSDHNHTFIYDEIIKDWLCTNVHCAMTGSEANTLLALAKRQSAKLGITVQEWFDRQHYGREEQQLKQKMNYAYDPTGDSGTLEDQYIRDQLIDQDDETADKGAI